MISGQLCMAKEATGLYLAWGRKVQGAPTSKFKIRPDGAQQGKRLPDKVMSLIPDTKKIKIEKASGCTSV